MNLHFLAIKQRSEDLRLLRHRRDVNSMKEIFNLHHDNETYGETFLKKFIYENEPQQHKDIKENIRR